MSTNRSELEQAIYSLAQIDAFHSRDPIESLEAVVALAEAWKTLVLHHPEALSNLIDSRSGRTEFHNSITVATACITRVIEDLASARARGADVASAR